MTLYESIRMKIRSTLHSHVERSIFLILWMQQFQWKTLDSLARSASIFGDEGFFAVFFPTVFWLFGQRVGTFYHLLVGIGIFWGNFFKDTFCLPRPVQLNPEVHAQVECGDWGLPSTHSISAASLPLFTVYMYAYKEPVLPLVPSVALGLFWWLSISLSRMYLGVHSPADVFYGCLIGLSVTLFFICFGDLYLDALATGHPLALLAVAGIALVLFRIHPKPNPPTPSMGESSLVLGMALGVSFSYASTQNSGFFSQDSHLSLSNPAWKSILASGLSPAQHIVAILVIGFFIVLSSRAVLKAVFRSVLAPLYKYLGWVAQKTPALLPVEGHTCHVHCAEHPSTSHLLQHLRNRSSVTKLAMTFHESVHAEAITGDNQVSPLADPIYNMLKFSTYVGVGSIIASVVPAAFRSLNLF